MPSSTTAAKAQAKAKILIVDDHPVVREGLAVRINAQPDLAVCGEAATAAEALSLVRDCSPDLVIVELSLEGSSGLDLIKRLEDRCPTLPVLVFSVHDEMLYAQRVMEAGAKGCLMKREVGETLLLAIRRVLGGSFYFSDQVMSRLMEGVASKQDRTSGLKRLSDRELEVWELVGQGLTGQQMAQRLHLSNKTVEVYRLKIRQKLNLDSAAELAQVACAFAWGQGPLMDRASGAANEHLSHDGTGQDFAHDLAGPNDRHRP